MEGAGPEPQEENAEAALMRNGARKWILRVGSNWREIPAPALLAMLCASAFSPLIAVGAGITGAAAVAGIGMLSSVGGSVLTDAITQAIDKLRPQKADGSASPSDIEEALATEIGKVLASGTAAATVLRAEIGRVLEGIDLSGAMLREAIDSGNEQLRSDLLGAISVLDFDFAELRFLVSDAAAAAATIVRELDEQRANMAVISQQNTRQSVEIRRASEVIAVIERRTRPGTRAGDGGLDARVRWEGSPYRGLLPFSEDDAEIFYGRERLTTDLAVKVAGQMTRGGLLVVTGASGAGKSSLLRAGLLPALARGLQVQGSQRWPCRVMTPTKDPFGELAAQLAALAGGSAAMIAADLAADPGSAHLAARQAVLASGTARMVIVVDQFEQIFTLNSGSDRDWDAERKRFITALCAMAANPAGEAQEPPALVVIAVRGDFLDRCAAYAELATAMQQSQFVVGPMTDSDLRLAITGPADAAGLRLEPSLIDTILADLRAAGTDTPAGVLPLLSQAMLLTWENRDGDWLTSRGYGKSGGIDRAIEMSADAVYSGLPAADQALAKQILCNMTAISRDARLSRRPVTTAALHALPGVGPAQANEILEKFADKRLVVRNEGTAEIAHDALLTAWPRLRGWLKEDQASWSLHRELEDDAEEWSHGRQPEFLYRGIQLADASRAVSTWDANRDRYPAVTAIQREFLQASHTAARNARARRRAVTAVVAALVLLAATAGGLAWRFNGNAGQQQEIALTQHAIALSEQLASASTSLDASDPVTARRLALAAWSVSPTSQATAAVVTELTEQVRDGHLPADPAHSGLVNVGLAGGGVSGVAFSPDGRLLATGGADVRVWDPADGRPLGVPLAVDGSGSTGVAFSPDGRLIASADTAGDVQVWNATSGRLALDLHSGGPAAGTASVYREAVGEDVAFSPDGRLVVSGSSDGYVRIWDVATGSSVGRPIAVDPPVGGQTGLDPGVTAVAFSPGSGLLAAVGGSGYVRFWNPLTGAPAGTPLLANPDRATDSSGVVAIAFSRDGRLLATAGRVGQVRIWTVASRSLAAGPLTVIGLAKAGPASCLSLAFSRNGTLLACAGLGTAELFDARTGKYLGEFIEPDISAGDYSEVNVVAFSPRADLLATGNMNGTATLWNATAGTQNGTTVGAQLTSTESQSRDEGVLPASRDMLIAGSGSDGYARLVGSALPAGADQGAWGIAGEAFSPDGRLVAVFAGRELRLLDARTGKPWLKPIVTPDQLAGVVFSPHGDLVATVDAQGRGRLWNTATGTSIGQPFTVGGANDAQQLTAEQAMAFSPDGQLLAVAGLDGNVVQLLSTATASPVRKTVAAGPVPASSAATGGPPAPPPPPPAVIGLTGSVTFSTSGGLLASASGDGYVRLWNPATGALDGRPIAVDPASQQSASQGVAALALSPDGRYLATVDGNGQIQLWDTKTRLAAGLPFPASSLNNQEGLSFTPAAVAFSADGSVLVGVSQYGEVEAWPTWLFTDPHAALCAQVGPPTAVEWAKYAKGEPESDMCG